MAGLGINTVRTYTPPRPDLLDEAARHGLRVMVGLPWSQHVAFLDDRRADARRSGSEIVAPRCARSRDHPAALMFALGNEIPPAVVRWHGRVRDRALPARLYRRRARRRRPTACSPTSTSRRPSSSTSPFFDVCAFNVYLHREAELRAYLARLQHIAGHKPLLLAEAGADSIREGQDGQAEHHRDARPRGVRGRRVRRGRVRLDRRVVARRPSRSTTGRSAWSIASGSPKPAAGRRRARRSPTRRSPPRRAGARGRRSRWWSAPTTPPTRSTTA